MKTIKDHPDIHGGMLPKLECSIQAVSGGVESSGDKDPNGIYLSRYVFRKPL